MIMSRLVVLNDYREIVRVYDEYGNQANNSFSMFTEEGIYRAYDTKEGLYVVVRVRPKIPKSVYEAYYEVVLLEEPNTELIDVGMTWIENTSEEKIYEVAKYVLGKYRYKRKAETEVV
jgi:hypothetical protein